MNLEDLKKLTYDLKTPIDELLINYRPIAKKIKNNTLINWINKELNGYEKNEIPPYRFIKNDILNYTIKGNKKAFDKNGKVSLQSLIELNKRHEYLNGRIEESVFFKDISYVAISVGVTEIQHSTDRRFYERKNLTINIDDDKNFIIDPEEIALTKNIPESENYFETHTRLLQVIVDNGKLYTVANNIRIILQDFIDQLEQIEDWNNNQLTSILIDKTFTFNININVNNTTITNRIDSGDGNIINNGNNNISNISNNDVIRRCLDIVEDIKTSDKEIENLKLSITNTLNEFTKNNINSKTQILEKISAIIVTSTAVLADAATSMPLLAPLLNYLKG